MGQLFYVIGSSGVGKDAVMEYARKKINGEAPVLFSHRYITRPADSGGENHIALTKEEFNCMLQGNLFVFNWNSHEKNYGIGIEINYWLDHGYNVIVNGSRAYLAEAHKKKENIKVILITAKPETIKQRLLNRGRESQEEIEKRIKRNKSLKFDSSNITEISNDGDLEEAGDKFIRLIT
jgi:ribose 1,5-bisphosphokinase